MTGSFAAAVDRVLRSNNCTGCGACAALSPRVRMELDPDGFSRPVLEDAGTETVGTQSDSGATSVTSSAAAADARTAEEFEAVCPGVAVVAPDPAGAPVHRTLGRHVSAWTAWAADPDLRFAGSSGGVLTALSTWLLDAGIASSVVGAGGSAAEPSRTVALTLRTRADVLASAGSRYAPVSNAQLFDPSDPDTAFVGKPCEVYAVRQILGRSSDAPKPSPVLLSFFCAGVPSQNATADLLRSMGMNPEDARSVRYRGNGWPGDFVATDVAGRSVSADYQRSWGEHLGPRVQDRCKICPDGTGEHADIAVGDYWAADESGFPVFAATAGTAKSSGTSVAIARTEQGHRLLLQARDAGVVVLGPVELDEVAAVQPLQTKRRLLLFGRLLGRRLAGRRIPKFRGFSLLRPAIRAPRATASAAKGSFARTRRAARGTRAQEQVRG